MSIPDASFYDPLGITIELLNYISNRLMEVFMKQAKYVGLITVVIFIFLASLAFAQPRKGGQGSGGWGMGMQYQRMYDPATVETISGTVESIDKITPMKGMSYGIHIMLKTDKENLSVHLGPAWYIERQDIKIEKGDTVEVKGSRVKMMDSPAIIAAEVKKGDDILLLRDIAGMPKWAGWRRR